MPLPEGPGTGFFNSVPHNSLARHSPIPTRPVKLEMQTFVADPFKIVGMSFVLQDGGEGTFYEVAEIGSSKEKTWYQVQFEGCADYMPVERQEMMEMVQNSVMLII
jgi:hypothetical protein